MTKLCKELLQTTLKSFRRACASTDQITNNPSGSLVKELQTLPETRLPLIDQLLIRRFENARTRGLIATRQENFSAAERFFAVARMPLQRYEFSAEGSLLYKSYLCQAEAYLDYRRGDFEQARSRTFEALAIDIALEEEHGYEPLVLHRIQLVHNLVRIDARCMHLERAIELACQILNYLDGELELLPIPGSWGYERVKRQSPELVAAMFAQVTNEIAIILAGRNRQLACDLFVVACSHLQLQANSSSHYHSRAHAWLLVKQAFVNNDVAAFLELASYFLGEGRSDTPLLWYATVIDLVALCDELDLPDSRLLKQEVANKAATWEYLPRKFYYLLCNSVNTEMIQQPDTFNNPKPGKVLST
ncbi:MAG: hypothetical protein KME50_29580 [Nostoc desertorum CM1-VF14]|jgi:hypothetical protein|nr:hypothetical protein [Nostoc desertorum CM1-VF14]